MVFLVLGCPVTPEEEGSATLGVDSGDGPDDGQDDGQTSSNMTGGTSMGEEDTGTPPDTSASDTSEDTADGSDGSDTATTGDDVCEIMLPPPGECTMGAPEEPPSYALLAGQWPSNVQPDWDASDTVVDDDDPAGGPVTFIMDPDGGGSGIECDTYAQDCPKGEKCMPWANDGGGSWNALRCSPVANNPNQVGDDCMVEGSGVSGIDDCDLGQMCWDVDPETNVGVCIELCTCSPANPICNTPNTSCVITNQGVLNICLDVCNPLDTSACNDGQGCYPAGDLFHCAPDVSGGDVGQGDPCQFINTCPGGMACVGPESLSSCSGAGCCTAFCDEDADCPGGLSCLPWYDTDAAPDECLGMTGICADPA